MGLYNIWPSPVITENQSPRNHSSGCTRVDGQTLQTDIRETNRTVTDIRTTNRTVTDRRKTNRTVIEIRETNKIVTDKRNRSSIYRVCIEYILPRVGIQCRM